MSDFAKTPYTAEQIENINAFQACGHYHPFTCGAEGCREVLVATEEGMACPKCDYRQTWVHDFMANGHAVAMSRRIQQWRESPPSS